MDVSSEAKISRIDDLVGARVRQDGLSVDAGLMGEGAEPGDVVVEGDVDLDGLRDEILQVSELVQFVLAHDVVAVGDNHAGHKTAERGDAVPLSDAQHGGVDVGRPGLERTVGVRDGAPSVVVEMCLNIARDDTPQGTDEIVDLSRRRTSNGVGDALERKEKKRKYESQFRQESEKHKKKKVENEKRKKGSPLDSHQSCLQCGRCSTDQQDPI